MKDDVVVAPGDEIIFATGTRFEGTKERIYDVFASLWTLSLASKFC